MLGIIKWLVEKLKAVFARDPNKTTYTPDGYWGYPEEDR